MEIQSHMLPTSLSYNNNLILFLKLSKKMQFFRSNSDENIFQIQQACQLHDCEYNEGSYLQQGNQPLRYLKEDDQYQSDLSLLFPNVGMFRTNWYTNQNIYCFDYGTGFAISDRILITCTHNIFSQRKKKFCSEALFIPNINRGKISNQPIYRSAQNTNANKFYRCLISNDTLHDQQLQEQLTLIALQSPLPTSNFLKIGTIGQGQYTKSKNLMMVGYPSRYYHMQANLHMVQSNRKVLYGNLFEVDKHIIRHTMKTCAGMRGSPILSQNSYGQYLAVGIQTHRQFEKGYNSGLFFNKKTVKQIQQFQISLKQTYSLSSMPAYFHQFQQYLHQNNPLPPQVISNHSNESDAEQIQSSSDSQEHNGNYSSDNQQNKSILSFPFLDNQQNQSDSDEYQAKSNISFGSSGSELQKAEQNEVFTVQQMIEVDRKE